MTPWDASTVLPVASRRNWWPVVAVVAVLALVVLAGALVRLAASPGHAHRDDVCRQAYAARIGHDPGDTSFWLVLQDCARRGELPDGANDPGYYQ